MTISSTANKVTLFGNGTTTSWPFKFLIPAQSQMSVIVTDSLGNQATLTASQYAVTGIGSRSGGSVTYPLSGSPLAALSSITILRTLPLVQQTDIVNQDGFFPDVLESTVDYLTMVDQQISEAQARALALAVTDINGSGAYRASGNRISSLGYPNSDTDAATYGAARDIGEALTAGVVGGYGFFLQNGAGAVGRTFQDKQREIVSVTDFGFVSGSYGAALNRAIEAAVNVGHAKLLIPRKGTFQIEVPVPFDLDTWFDGMGKLSTMLLWEGSGPGVYARPAVFNSSLRGGISNLSVIGSAASIGGGIEISDQIGFKFSQVGVSGFTQARGLTLRNINAWTEGTQMYGVELANNKYNLAFIRDPGTTGTGSFGYTKIVNSSILVKDGQVGVLIGDDNYNTDAHALYNSQININIWQQGNSQAWKFGQNSTCSDSKGLVAGEYDSTFTGIFLPANTPTSGFRNADIFFRSSPQGRAENQFSQWRDLRYKKFRDIGSKAAGTGTTVQWFQVAKIGATKGIFMGSLFTQSSYGTSAYCSAAVQFAFGNPGNSGAGGFVPVFQVSGDAFELGNSNAGQPHFKLATDASGNVYLFFRRPAYADVCEFDYSYDWETGETVELWTPTSDPASLAGYTVVWDSYTGTVQSARNGDEMLAAVQRLNVTTNGGTLVYSFAHNYTDNAGNGVAPQFYQVSPISADACSTGIASVAVTTANVVITMKTNTPSGTGNVTFAITLGRKSFWKQARPA